MARLFMGEKDANSTDIVQLLEVYDQGLREAEIADMLGWDRRRLNNYLRDLRDQGQIYQEGRLWFAEE